MACTAIDGVGRGVAAAEPATGANRDIFVGFFFNFVFFRVNVNSKNWKFGSPPKGSGARARSARYTRRVRSACTPKVALHRARAARLLQKFGRARAARLLPEVRERASHTSTLAQFTDGGARCAAQKRGARSASAPPQATGREKARQNSHWQPAAQLPKLMCGRIATTSARTPQ